MIRCWLLLSLSSLTSQDPWLIQASHIPLSSWSLDATWPGPSFKSRLGRIPFVGVHKKWQLKLARRQALRRYKTSVSFEPIRRHGPCHACRGLPVTEAMMTSIWAGYQRSISDHQWATDQICNCPLYPSSKCAVIFLAVSFLKHSSNIYYLSNI